MADDIKTRLAIEDTAIAVLALRELDASKAAENLVMDAFEKGGILDEFNTLGPMDMVVALRSGHEKLEEDPDYVPRSLEELGVSL